MFNGDNSSRFCESGLWICCNGRAVALCRVALQPFVQPILPQLAIKRRPADPQRTRDARHAVAVVRQRELDQFAFHIGEGGDFAIAADEPVGDNVLTRTIAVLCASGVDVNGG